MKPARQFLPPRQSVVYRHTREMLDATACNYTTFAMAVAEHYLAMTAPDVRQVKLRTGEGIELIKAMDNNAQVIRRYMDGTVKTLPADLEDAWVVSLSEPYRSQCERDLARRRGTLPVRLSVDTEAAQAVGIADLMSEFGQLVAALSPAMSDGRIDAADLPHARKILDESDDLIGAVIGVRRRVQALLPEVPLA
ncbi:MAG TPA: hypothetical protein VEY92_11365 [Pseudoxanthomonas sp.]|nr:hypothetical protein [Pseudoxanthomonas sp.]